MYAEFVIPMTVPAGGLLLIYVFYRAQRWRIEQSGAATEDDPDTEKGALHKQTNSLEDADAMAARQARDLCIWLAIGWLFMVTRLAL
jgi:hypothetical protein